MLNAVRAGLSKRDGTVGQGFAAIGEWLRGHIRGVMFGALMVILISIEILCVLLSYYTAGDVFQEILVLAMLLNILPIVLYVRRSMVLAVVVAMIIGAMIVPLQIVDGIGLMHVREEAAGVVAYVYQIRVQTGSFPRTLAGYRFIHPGSASVMHYTFEGDRGSFTVAYRVPGNPSDYWYRPEDGWQYYSD